MKYTCKIEELTRDELVSLFSAALTGSFWLRVEVPTRDELKCLMGKEAYEEVEDSLCIEDILALWVLNGKKVRFEDMYAEDKDEINGDKGQWDKDQDCAYYMIGLDDIKEGLGKASCGDDWDRECFNSFVDEEGMNMDLPRAEGLMQIIMFGEVVYG